MRSHVLPFTCCYSWNNATNSFALIIAFELGTVVDSLYQDQLLALAKLARTAPSIVTATHHAEAKNPVCGDHIVAQICVEGAQITAAGIKAKGCALCEAGAGLWLETVIGRSITELPLLYQSLDDWLTTDDNTSPLQSSVKKLPAENLTAFLPVRAIKNRHKCVTLAFATAEKFQPV